MDDHEDIAGLEGQGAPATAEALKSIVARHRRGRTRTLGVALAVALVAGPVAGWALASTGQHAGRQVATGAAPDKTSRDASAPAAMTVGGGGVGFGPAGPLADATPAHHLFTRTTADGIVVRAYRTDPPTPPAATATSTTVPAGKAPSAGVACRGFVTGGPGKPVPPEAGVSTGSPGQASSSANASASADSGASGGSSTGPANPDAPPPAGGVPAPMPCPPIPPDCKPTPSLIAELSNDAAVGQGFYPLAADAPSTPLSLLGPGVFGGAEGSPAMWVAVRTGPGVGTARLRLPSGATDEMAPVEGVAVLAHGTTKPPPDGTVVEALDRSGKVIASQDITKPQGPQMVTACAVAMGGTATATAKATASAPPTTR
jgi:hypothetical protein